MAAVLDEHLRGRKLLVGDRVTVADFVMAYTLDWGNENHLLEDFPQLRAYMERMYARPKAAPRIAEAFASIEAGSGAPDPLDGTAYNGANERSC